LGVGSGTEVIGIGDRRGEKLMKDMGMIGGDRQKKGRSQPGLRARQQATEDSRLPRFK